MKEIKIIKTKEQPQVKLLAENQDQKSVKKEYICIDCANKIHLLPIENKIFGINKDICGYCHKEKDVYYTRQFVFPNEIIYL